MTGEGWLAVGALIVTGITVVGNVWKFYLQKEENKRRDNAHTRNLESGNTGEVAKIIFEEVKSEEDKKAEEKIKTLVSRFGDIFRKLKEEWKK